MLRRPRCGSSAGAAGAKHQSARQLKAVQIARHRLSVSELEEK
ncbi:hypothetical protein PF003_g6087 [Phytophthora fragariae]|nr:hypothetical protein PF003_g6087 [Phytophthora fragariae]